MKILSELDNYVIVQYTKEEFDILRKGIEQTVKHSIDSKLYSGLTMTFRYGNQVIRKTREELAFEDYCGLFIPD